MQQNNKVTKPAVTCFLQYNDDFLFLRRKSTASIDPNKYNGIGGKVDPGEDYISAVIREVKEESGYIITNEDIIFNGFIYFEKGYTDKWMTAFFKIEVPTLEIPTGNNITEGELVWIKQNKVLNSNLDLVDDINYIFNDIIETKRLFFMSATVDEITKKIIKHSLNYL